MSGCKKLAAAFAAIVISGACSLGWATIGLAADSDIEPLSDASLEEKAARLFTYLTGAKQGESSQRIQNYLKVSELVDELEYAAADLYGENDLRMVPWLYLTAMDRYRLAGILASGDSRVRYQALLRMAGENGGKRLNAVGSVIDAPWAATGSDWSVRQLRKSFMQEATRKYTEIAKIYESAGRLEAQAMALIYRADFQLLQNQGTPFVNYREAQELLRQSGIPQERIEAFFNRPQLIPANRFFPTLEAAIENQVAELAARLPPHYPSRQAPYFAWDESVPAVRAPLPIDTLSTARESYQAVDLRFRLSAEGDVRAVNVVAAPDSEQERISRLVRESAYILHFRPALEDGRGQAQSGLHMRFHLPDGID